jgi:hypothetical protein
MTLVIILHSALLACVVVALLTSLGLGLLFFFGGMISLSKRQSTAHQDIEAFKLIGAGLISFLFFWFLLFVSYGIL